MKITYDQNPLKTKVELDEHEKKEFWYKIKIEEMTDLLFGAHFSLTEEKDYFDVARARQEVDPDYYCQKEGTTMSDLDKRVTEEVEMYIKDLQGSHGGDCTCVPCSCSKCHAESILGIDTIKGLGKHQAVKIESAFRKGATLDEVIKSLENYNPQASWEGWEAYAPRWQNEAADALRWLKQYKELHFK